MSGPVDTVYCPFCGEPMPTRQAWQSVECLDCQTALNHVAQQVREQYEDRGLIGPDETEVWGFNVLELEYPHNDLWDARQRRQECQQALRRKRSGDHHGHTR